MLICKIQENSSYVAKYLWIPLDCQEVAKRMNVQRAHRSLGLLRTDAAYKVCMKYKFSQIGTKLRKQRKFVSCQNKYKYGVIDLMSTNLGNILSIHYYMSVYANRPGDCPPCIHTYAAI